MSSAFRIDHRPRLLVAEFERSQTILSWSMTRPAFRTARRVAWLEVRDADLPATVDPFQLLNDRMCAEGLADAIAMMTSRNLAKRTLARHATAGVEASCLATVGLSNAGRVGERPPAIRRIAGTINLLVHVDRPLDTAAMVEAVSIVAQARTAAILECGVRRDGVAVTGTGTDCIVIASSRGRRPERFAGLHTGAGQALGAAAFRAVEQGCREWLAEQASGRPDQTTSTGGHGR